MTAAERRIRSELIKAIQARPFRPFVIRRDDGRFYRITHPEIIDVSPHGGSVLIALPSFGNLVLIPLHILTAIEYPPPRTRTSDAPT